MLLVSILKEVRSRCAMAMVAERMGPMRRPERRLKGKPRTVRHKFTLVAGTPKVFCERFRADVCFKPSEIASDVPRPGVVVVERLKFGNVSAMVGRCLDAYLLAQEPYRVHGPIVECGFITFAGEYTGLVPEGVEEGQAFDVTFSVTGPGDESFDVQDPGLPTESPPAPEPT